MASYTENLNLLKKDPTADASDTFNVKTMMNENWDKIDANAAGVEAELAERVNKNGDTMSGNLAIANGNGYFESGLFSGCGFLKLHAVNGSDSTRIQIETGADKDPYIERVIDGVVVSSFEIATATPPDEYDLPLASGLSIYFGRATYWKDQFGQVHFLFSIKKSGITNDIPNNSLLFTLPVGFRPSNNGNATFSCTEGRIGSPAESGFLQINADGTCYLFNSSAFECGYVCSSGAFIAGN